MQPWTCARCLVPCGAEEIKCPACQELRPGCSPSDAEDSSPDQPSIQFGAAPAAKAAESSTSNGTPAFGPAFGAIPLPSHDPFGASPSIVPPAAATTNVTQPPPVLPTFPRAASPPQHPVFGSQQMARPEFGAHTPLKTGFSVQFGSQLSSSVDEEETPPEMAAAALNVPEEPVVEKENHDQGDSHKAASTKVDAGRFTFGTSQLIQDLSTTPAAASNRAPAPPSPLRASGQPSPGRFLDALATTPVKTSGPDSPLLRDYDPSQPKPYPKRDPHRRGIVYNWGSGECDQLAVKQECLEEGMCLKPLVIRRLNQPIAKSIVCGAMHNACIVERGQAVWTWGCNDEKALGRPIRLDTKRKNADGEVYEIKIDGPLVDPCWSTVHPPPDSNYYLCKAPGPVWGLPEKVEIVKVTAGDSHTAIITATGDCWVWGAYRDGTGPLGFPDFSKEPGAYVRHQIVPVKIPGLTGSCIRLISGENHTVVMTYCARDRKYRVYAWGANPYGQLGGTPTDHEDPRKYLWPREIKLSELQFMVAENETSLCVHPKNDAIRRNGLIGDIYGGRATLFLQISYDGTSGVFGMGRNACGELGAGCEVTCVSTPVALKTPPGYVWKDIKGGDWFTMGYTHDGAVFTWGHCEYVGQGSEVAASKKNVLVPKKLPGLRQMVAEISASDKAAYIVTFSGELFVWGENQSGQLGLGRQDEQPVSRPTHVPLSTFSNQPVLSVAAGSQHALAIIQADEAQLERGTKRRREDDDAPAEDVETTAKRRRADGEQQPAPKPDDDSMDLSRLLKVSPVTPHNQNSTVELPVVAPAEVSPSKKEDGYISDDDEPESGAIPDNDDTSSRPLPKDEDVAMAGARIGIEPSAAEEDDEEEEADDEDSRASAQHDEEPADGPEHQDEEDIKSNSREVEAAEKEAAAEDGNLGDESEGPDGEEDDTSPTTVNKTSKKAPPTPNSAPEEEDEESEQGDQEEAATEEPVAAAPKKPKAKAKAKAKPKKAAAPAAKAETTRPTRKRLPTVSATPADGELSDISQPPDAGAPKRSRAAASSVKKEERGVKRQASASPERDMPASTKKARTVRSTRKGTASQETTPVPHPPVGDSASKASKTRGKATDGDATASAAARKISTGEPAKTSSGGKKVEKRSLRHTKSSEDPPQDANDAGDDEAVPQPPAKRSRTRTTGRTQSQEAEEPAAVAKAAPKKAVAKPKSKAKSTKASSKQAVETEEEVEQPAARKTSGQTTKNTGSRSSKSQPTTTTTATKAGGSKKTAKSQPEEEDTGAKKKTARSHVDEEDPIVKKAPAKAKSKEMPRRATRSQASKETDGEPNQTRKTTRSAKK